MQNHMSWQEIFWLLLRLAERKLFFPPLGGTPHISNYRSVLRVGGWVVYQDNNATPWLHLASWNLPDSQLSWESKMEPSVAITKKRYFTAIVQILYKFCLNIVQIWSKYCTTTEQILYNYCANIVQNVVWILSKI